MSALRGLHLSLAFAVCAAVPFTATRAADPEVTIVLRNHRFEPAEVKVPSNTKIKLVIDNQDPTPEEFESHQLNREKVIPGRSKGTVYIGPLKPGRYAFFGEYNEKTARGTVVAE
ncbi:MAG: cupredoxin domain-containing protein [Burkholderiaceae bacterium]